MATARSYPDTTRVRVATHKAATGEERSFAWRHLAQEHVNAIWIATGELPDDIRSAAFPLEFTGRDPTEPWPEVELSVDGVPRRFRVLLAGDAWGAQGQFDNVVVSIRATRWTIEDTGLVSVFDVREYFEGSEEMRRRAQERRGGGS